jgi:hypothetical protein
MSMSKATVEPSSRLISRPAQFGRTGLNGAAGCDARMLLSWTCRLPGVRQQT